MNKTRCKIFITRTNNGGHWVLQCFSEHRLQYFMKQLLTDQCGLRDESLHQMRLHCCSLLSRITRRPGSDNISAGSLAYVSNRRAEWNLKKHLRMTTSWGNVKWQSLNTSVAYWEQCRNREKPCPFIFYCLYLRQSQLFYAEWYIIIKTGWYLRPPTNGRSAFLRRTTFVLVILQLNAK